MELEEDVKGPLSIQESILRDSASTSESASHVLTPEEAEKKELSKFKEEIQSLGNSIERKSICKEVCVEIENEVAVINNIVKGIEENPFEPELQNILLKHLLELVFDFESLVTDIVERIDLLRLFKALKDFTPEKSPTSFKTNALDFFCFECLRHLSIYSKTSIVLVICYIYHNNNGIPLQPQIWITKIITATIGDDLLSLKNKIDFFAGKHNFHKIVYSYIRDIGIRQTILDHLRKSKPENYLRHSARSTEPVKILSDIDDTMICTGGSFGCYDVRYPWGTVYPGVLSFYRELDRGYLEFLEQEESNLVFLTARPKFTEDKTYTRMMEIAQCAKVTRSTEFHTNSILLTGALMQGISSSWGNFNGMIAGKLENFYQYKDIYPDCQFIFIGDNGQGDYAAGKEMLHLTSKTLDVFIHEVQNRELTFGYDASEDRIHFFRTYIGAGIVAYEKGYFKADGLVRIVEETKLDFIRFEIKYIEDSKIKESRKREMIKKLIVTGHDHQISLNHIKSLKEEINRDITRAMKVLLREDLELLVVW